MYIVRLDSGPQRAARLITFINEIITIELYFCFLWICRLTECDALFAGQDDFYMVSANV